jgi:hypothetical protein
MVFLPHPPPFVKRKQRVVFLQKVGMVLALARMPHARKRNKKI